MKAHLYTMQTTNFLVFICQSSHMFDTTMGINHSLFKREFILDQIWNEAWHILHLPLLNDRHYMYLWFVFSNNSELFWQHGYVYFMFFRWELSECRTVNFQAVGLNQYFQLYFRISNHPFNSNLFFNWIAMPVLLIKFELSEYTILFCVCFFTHLHLNQHFAFDMYILRWMIEVT